MEFARAPGVRRAFEAALIKNGSIDPKVTVGFRENDSTSADKGTEDCESKKTVTETFTQEY